MYHIRFKSKPTQPTEVADIDNWYVHDGMVKGDTLYLAHISDGFFSIWDVSTPSAPVMLGQQNSPGCVLSQRVGVR